MTPAIRVESVSKQYVIGTQRSRPDTLRDLVAERLRRGESRRTAQPQNRIWALRDVSLEIESGEVVGIVGRNGAGKSTLLKILSRITRPTEGRALIYGRVGSLLEVGTGFHPELTGRQNIFLNGSILGMGRAEIRRKFDEIVDFAEIGRFLDTPVKRYSSGMYVRLAFAVAAHLQPEILLVDEVLAVGDAGFQRKCLGKMGEVAYGGRTVLFVSHNMAAVENLCSRAVVLADGTVAYEGGAADAAAHYIRTVGAGAALSVGERTDRQGTGGLRVTSLGFRSTVDGQTLHTVRSGEDIEVVLAYDRERSFSAREPIVAVTFYNQLGTLLSSVHNDLTGNQFDALPPSGTFVCRLPRIPLAPATYRVDFSVRRSVGDWEYVDSLQDAARLTVVDGDFYGTGVSPLPSSGFVLMDGSWHLETR